MSPSLKILLMHLPKVQNLFCGILQKKADEKSKCYPY